MSKPENQTPPPPWLRNHKGRCPLCHTESQEVIESNTRKAALDEIGKRLEAIRDDLWWPGSSVMDDAIAVVRAVLAPASPAAPETTTAEEADAISDHLQGDRS